MQFKLGFVGVVLSLVLVACSSNRAPTQGTLTKQAFSTRAITTAVAAPRGGVGAVVVGYTEGSLAGVNQGGTDAFVRKYNSSGVVWTRQFGTSADDQATDVAVTPTGISYVVSYTKVQLGGSDVFFLRKYDANGVVQWTRQLYTGSVFNARDVALDSSGNVYVLSSDTVRKFSPSGTLITNFTADVRGSALAVDSTGNIFVLSKVVINSGRSFTGRYAKLFKYNSAGVLVASPDVFSITGVPGYGLFVDPDDLIIDSSNNLYLSVRSSSGTFIRKVTNTGAVLWTHRILSTAVYLNLAIGPRGSVFVTSATGGAYPGFTNAGRYDIFVIQLNGTTGARLWTRQFGGNLEDYGQGIAVSDNVYVAGYSLSNPNLLGLPGYVYGSGFLAQLDRFTGTILSIDQ